MRKQTAPMWRIGAEPRRSPLTGAPARSLGILPCIGAAMTLPQIDARPANPADSERRAQAPSPLINRRTSTNFQRLTTAKSPPMTEQASAFDVSRCLYFCAMAVCNARLGKSRPAESRFMSASYALLLREPERALPRSSFEHSRKKSLFLSFGRHERPAFTARAASGQAPDSPPRAS